MTSHILCTLFCSLPLICWLGQPCCLVDDSTAVINETAVPSPLPPHVGPAPVCFGTHAMHNYDI